MNIDLCRKMIHECEIILMGKKRLRLFGILSFGMTKKVLPLEEQEYPEDFPNQHNEVLSVSNGKELLIIPREDVNREYLMYSILHQLMHHMSKHFHRTGDRDPVIWNMACDHVVNRVLKGLAETLDKLSVPKDSVFFEDLEYGNKNASAEQIYDLLLKKMPPPPPKKSPQNGSGEGEGEGEGEGGETPSDNGDSDEDQDGQNQGDSSRNQKRKNERYTVETKTGSNNITYTKIQDQQKNKTFVCTMDTVHSKEEKGEIEKLEDKMEEQAKQLWHSSELSKGDLPGSFLQYFDYLLRIEVPWQEIMRNAILYTVQCRKRRSWMEPNFYIRKPKVPGKCPKSKDVKYLVVVIDTSGSISDEDLRMFLGIVLDSVQHFKGLIVLLHDVTIHKELRYEKIPPILTLLSEIQNITGRGGTSHKYVFSRLQELYDEDDISNVVFLTDYASDIQYIYHNYEWIRRQETTWLITTDRKVELDGCETKVIRIDSKRASTYRAR